MSSESTSSVMLDICITLRQFQSHFPAAIDSQHEPMSVCLSIEFLNQKLTLAEITLASEGSVAEVESQSRLSWQSSSPNFQIAGQEILESLLNDEIVLRLQNQTTSDELATGVLDVSSFAQGINPIEVEEIPLKLLDQGATGPETVATVSLSLAVYHSEDQDRYFQLVSEEDVLEGCILQIVLSRLAPLPQGLQDAFSAVPESQLTLGFGLNLDCGEENNTQPFLFVMDFMEDQELRWSRGKKRVLTSESKKQLRDALQKGDRFVVEIWRLLTEEGLRCFADPAFHQYNAVAMLNLNALLNPGATELNLQLEFNETLQEFVQRAPTYQSQVQPPLAEGKPNPKRKPIEEISHLSESANAWSDAGSVLEISIRISSPLIPPWSPPARPLRTLQELLPNDGETGLSESSPSTWIVFKDKVKEVVLSLQEREALLKSSGGQTELESKELNRYKDHLREAVTDIAKEMYNRHSLSEIKERKNELYVHLMQLAEEVLHQQDNSGIPDLTSIQQLEKRAKQYEAGGNWKLARRNHLDRIALCASTEAWTDLGAFYLRISWHQTAEECLKRALAKDKSNIRALTLLACLLMHYGFHDKDAGFEEAEAVIHEILDQEPDNLRTWELLTVLYSSMEREDDLRNCQFKVKEFQTKLPEANVDNEPFLELAEGCLEHNLIAFTETVLNFATNSMYKTRISVKLEIKKENFQAALDLIEKIRCQEETNLDPCTLELKGEALLKLGLDEDAKRVYSDLLQNSAESCTIAAFPAYAMILQSSHSEERFEFAENVYLRGLELHPENVCLWVELGSVLFQQGKVLEAELAWNEASTLDPSNPNIWAHLTLLYLDINKPDASTQTLSQAISNGLEDSKLVEKILTALATQGYHPRIQKLISLLQSHSLPTTTPQSL